MCRRFGLVTVLKLYDCLVQVSPSQKQIYSIKESIKYCHILIGQKSQECWPCKLWKDLTLVSFELEKCDSTLWKALDYGNPSRVSRMVQLSPKIRNSDYIAES